MGELPSCRQPGGKPAPGTLRFRASCATGRLADGTGRGADSSAGYILPNGAIRSPDASWLSNEKLTRLSTAQRARFLPVCPDFVIELCSPSDPMPALKAKMAEYAECGAALGWLIDPLKRQVLVYRPGMPVEVVDSPESMAADPELAGFTLRLKDIWPA